MRADRDLHFSERGLVRADSQERDRARAMPRELFRATFSPDDEFLRRELPGARRGSVDYKAGNGCKHCHFFQPPMQADGDSGGHTPAVLASRRNLTKWLA